MYLIFHYYFETDWFPGLLLYLVIRPLKVEINRSTLSHKVHQEAAILRFHNTYNYIYTILFYQIQNTKLNLTYFPGQYEFEPLEDETPSLSTKQVFPKSINPNINIVTFMLNLR